MEYRVEAPGAKRDIRQQELAPRWGAKMLLCTVIDRLGWAKYFTRILLTVLSYCMIRVRTCTRSLLDRGLIDWGHIDWIRLKLVRKKKKRTEKSRRSAGCPAFLADIRKCSV